MDKNYKIVEIPEVPSHHPGMEQAYLIFVTNAVNAVSVKKILKNQKNTIFGNFVVNLRTFQV